MHADLKREYLALFAAAALTPARKAEAISAARRIANARPRYDGVSKATGIPWYIVGIIHAMHCDGQFGRDLSGASIKDADWERYAIEYLSGVKGDWRTVEGIAYALEEFNGWGYRQNETLSPYLWAGTSVQEPGTYVSPTTFVPWASVDCLGAVALLKGMLEVDRAIDIAIPAAVEQWSKAPAKSERRAWSLWLWVALFSLFSISATFAKFYVEHTAQTAHEIAALKVELTAKDKRIETLEAATLFVDCVPAKKSERQIRKPKTEKGQKTALPSWPF